MHESLKDNEANKMDILAAIIMKEELSMNLLIQPEMNENALSAATAIDTGRSTLDLFI